mmetsp:Transcript_26441/g.40958  ORF Transcript_26441/g.40958 Transcript_26441/m.40958 type:complete len:203 (+) Transcript_26441:30-638(+)
MALLHPSTHLILMLNHCALLVALHIFCGPGVVDCFVIVRRNRNYSTSIKHAPYFQLQLIHAQYNCHSNNRCCFSSRTSGSVVGSTASSEENDATFSEMGENGAEDTIRVRIWRELASGEEVSLKQLGTAVGERRMGELKSHLAHVERQSKTLVNKSVQWRQRRGLLSPGNSNFDETKEMRRTNKLRIITRKGRQNQVFVQLK